MKEETNDDLFAEAIRKYWEGAFEQSIFILEELAARTNHHGEILEFRCRANLCEAYLRKGRYTDAVKCATRLIARAAQDMRLSPQIEEYKGEGIGSLGMALERLDLRCRWGELKPLLLEAFDIATRFDVGHNNYWVVQNQETLGICAARMKEFDRAQEWLDGALGSIRSFTPEPSFFRSRILQHFSTLARLRGDYAQAVEYALKAKATAEQNANFSMQLRAMSQVTLAEAESARGNTTKAQKILADVLSNSRVDRWYVERQRAEYLLSNLQREQGSYAEAKEAASNALLLAVQMKLREEEVLCALSRGEAELALGQMPDALEDFRRAKMLASARRYDDHLSSAVRRLQEIEKAGTN